MATAPKTKKQLFKEAQATIHNGQDWQCQALLENQWYDGLMRMQKAPETSYLFEGEDRDIGRTLLYALNPRELEDEVMEGTITARTGSNAEQWANAKAQDTALVKASCIIVCVHSGT